MCRFRSVVSPHRPTLNSAAKWLVTSMKMNLGRNLQVVKTVSVFKKKNKKRNYSSSILQLKSADLQTGADQSPRFSHLRCIGSRVLIMPLVTCLAGARSLKCCLHEVPGCRETPGTRTRRHEGMLTRNLAIANRSRTASFWQSFRSNTTVEIAHIIYDVRKLSLTSYFYTLHF